MGSRCSRLLASVLMLSMGGVSRASEAKGEAPRPSQNAAIAFRALPIGMGGPKAKLPVYIGIRNVGEKLMRLLPKGSPTVWGYSEAGGALPTKMEAAPDGAEERLGKLSGVVFSDSGPPAPTEYCPGSGSVLVALEKGNELLVETTVDMSLLEEGTHDLVLNVEALVVVGEGGCGPTVSQRGTARVKLQVRKDKISFVGPGGAVDEKAVKARGQR